MKQLLADHTFSDTLRYDNHRLIYGSTDQDRMELGGFLGAAVLGALLYGQDEGRERNIALNTNEGQQDFFARYEDETIHENGGYFAAEVQALNEAYMEINADKNLLLAICGNERLFDLAFGLTMDYMDKLVEEEIGEHIYDFVPWIGPFARWLYKAGYAETFRQQLLAINWANPEDVYALVDYIKEPEAKGPTFVFGGERADDLLKAYYNWLMTFIEQQAAQYPDSKVKLAEYKQIILQKEPHYEDLKPDMKDFTPEQLNLFRDHITVTKKKHFHDPLTGEEIGTGPNEIFIQKKRDYSEHPLTPAEARQRGNWSQACRDAQVIVRDKSHPRFMELYLRWKAQLSDPEPYKQFPAFVRTVLVQEG